MEENIFKTIQQFQW